MSVSVNAVGQKVSKLATGQRDAIGRLQVVHEMPCL